VPLHVTISGIFIGLIIFLGILLTWNNYAKTSEVILASASELYDRIAQELFLDFVGTYKPVVDTVNLLALSPVIKADDLNGRLQSLDLITSVLRSQPQVTGIQAGYPDGDYFIVRQLLNSDIRERFQSPPDAAFMVDHIDVDESGKRSLTRLFFDDLLREMAILESLPTDYDPRERPWYGNAPEKGKPAVSDPYLFHFLGKAGLTVSKHSPRPGVVLASDVTLENMSASLKRHRITPSTEVLLINGEHEVLGYTEGVSLVRRGEGEAIRITRMDELGSEVLAHITANVELIPGIIEFRHTGREWMGSVQRVSRNDSLPLYAVIVSPVDELLAEAVAQGWRSVGMTAIIMLVAIPIVWFLSSRISQSLRRLAGEAGAISRFDFSAPVATRSHIREVDQLALSMDLMKSTINRFLVLINSLAGERDFKSLLVSITHETLEVSQADGVFSYLLDDDGRVFLPGTLHLRGEGCGDAQTLPALTLDDDHPLVQACAGSGATLLTLDDQQGGVSAELCRLLDVATVSLLALPLRNRHDELVGVLCLVYREGTLSGSAHERQIAFVEALSGFAAVSLESRHLLMMQQALLDAFIKLIAGAIDAKSPYTGGHCQRVPELTRMLAQAAHDSETEPFAGFVLDADDWEALEIASWLHDCGKVTTPEYVVDKSTKLETIYDRIHEIRTRFEVLKRDAEIRCLERILAGGDPDTLRGELAETLNGLDADFAFVADCNLGGEYMDPERVQRLEQIAGRTWQRTLSDRIGISWEERRRKADVAEVSLPVTETLLADRPEHLIERADADRMPADNPWNFRMDVPEHKYNRGELYNLSIAKGTLTAEERYQINHHIVQTIMMLEKLPYPKHLRSVPLLAGCHHETMDGKGYPRRLTRDEMPLVARMMAIADIFEALTASDRPYKQAKTLSEAVRILGFMQQDGHIDPDLFRLFLESGLYRRYGERFLAPEQLDEVDIHPYLAATG